MDVEIVDWKNYCARKDIKRAAWVRLDANYLDEKAIQPLLVIPFAIPIHLWFLTRAANKNGEPFYVNEQRVAQAFGLEVCEVEAIAAELERCGLIKIYEKSEVIETKEECDDFGAHVRGSKVTLRARALSKVKLREVKLREVKLREVSKGVPEKTQSSFTQCIAVPNTSGSEVWFAYAGAYAARYKTSPVRNAKTNSLCKKLVQSIGVEKALGVVKHYLTIDDSWYLKKYHDLGLCISDYQKILTALETGINITATRANQIERQTATNEAFDRGLRMFQQLQGGENAESDTGFENNE